MEELVDFNAIDRAIMVSFFISYPIFALVQLNHLFNRRLVRFAVLLGAAAAITQTFAVLDLPEFCADGPSAIICNQHGRGLTAFGMIWVYVSVAVLGMFVLVEGLQRLRRQ